MGPASTNIYIKATARRMHKIVNELKKIHFTTTTDEDVFFDENGDPPARYDVLNWQQDKDDFGFLLKEMALQNMTGFQWVGSESWISDLNTANAEWQHILKGSLGFAIPKDISDSRLANNIYKAVYAVAYALHNSYGCYKRDSEQAAPNVCTNLPDQQKPWQIVNELKKINFTTTDEDVFFDENGDPPARYDVLNWQQDKD
ncbi:extracellular calcium-sensing receptor-like, partial [Clarias magur]